jgi:endonuclease/exonuclease/phosphatase family metal-dependent hydrolase
MARLLTYNVHRCVGVDRKLDVDRIAGVIADLEPDIVCLQELDVGRARTGGVDQAHAIAERLDMSFQFHPAMRVEKELYGDAILTRLPETLVRAAALPTLSGLKGLEPRGALWSLIQVDGVEINVLNTHLGLIPREQRLQATALMGKAWVGSPKLEGPVILAGDFNATSITRPYQILTRKLDDAQRRLGLKPSLKTFPSGFPAIRIDHCFVSDAIRITGARAGTSPLARMASDHLPLVIDFEVSPTAEPSRA